MKRITFILSLFIITVAISAQEIEKVAIISVYGNEKFETDWRESTLEIGTFNIELAEGKKFSASTELQNVKNLLLNDLKDEFPFTFADEKVVTENSTYQSYEPGTSSPKDDISIPSEGYKILSNLLKNNIYDLFNMLPDDIDAIMVVSLNFSLTRDNLAVNSGIGGAKGQATIFIKMYNSDGKKIFHLSRVGLSSAKVKVRLNKVPEKEYAKIPELMNEATQDLYDEIIAKLPKRIKKMHKKLAK
jgi:hypothetical protein